VPATLETNRVGRSASPALEIADRYSWACRIHDWPAFRNFVAANLGDWKTCLAIGSEGNVQNRQVKLPLTEWPCAFARGNSIGTHLIRVDNRKFDLRSWL
jgi:hypothetical protein